MPNCFHKVSEAWSLKILSHDALVALLESQERELHSASVRSNRARLEQLLAEDFLEIGASGTTYDRAKVVEFLVTLPASYEIWSDSYRLKSLSAEIALLTYRSWEVGPSGEKSREALRTSHWRCSMRQWRMVFHQGTLVES